MTGFAPTPQYSLRIVSTAAEIKMLQHIYCIVQNAMVLSISLNRDSILSEDYCHRNQRVCIYNTQKWIKPRSICCPYQAVNNMAIIVAWKTSYSVNAASAQDHTKCRLALDDSTFHLYCLNPCFSLRSYPGDKSDTTVHRSTALRQYSTPL